MKKLYLTIALFLVSTLTFSQDVHFKSAKEKNEHKPELFQHDEKNIKISNGFFNKVFSHGLGDTLTLELTPNVTINGKVIGAVYTDDFDIVSIICLNTPGLRLLMSHKHFDSEEEYFGFTICTNHKDGLKLERDSSTGNYQWIKKEMAEIIPD